jgi:hypothetical protein
LIRLLSDAWMPRHIIIVAADAAGTCIKIDFD